MPNRYDLLEVLAAIDPARLDYTSWASVGMVLHEEGYTAQDWDKWSSRDAARYHPGECTSKWRSFGKGGPKVTGGTIVQLARDQGWHPAAADGHELAWEDEIKHDEEAIIDTRWLEDKEVHEPDAWDPRQEMIRYLEALFDSTDKVGYVTETWNKDGKYMPTKGAYDRTAGELISKLQKCDDIEDVIGTVNPDVGAWIRFNPIDGKDVTNANVTDYRFALVESDSMPIEKQYALLTELQLPIKIMVHSGGKSLHAITKIDAGSMEEYRKRVDYLYKVLQKNGLIVDTQNRNPSRLSRLPGVTRKGNKQYIVAQDIGLSSFTEWQEWIEAATDDLPDLESMADQWDNLPPLAPALIDGILRQGHKMLIAGPSKAGKSYSLIELCIAIAEGTQWMGFDCAQGRVMYVNLELDRASCFHRFADVYNALHIPHNHLSNIDIWNLRGHAVPMDKLAPRLIRRAQKRGYIAVVIDPIYKVITGDENSADQMSTFCNQFDKVCTELGTAVIYCHHHSKGDQGNKKSMDRASGSGVFARDPDAMLDMIGLEANDAVKQYQKDRMAKEAIEACLNKYCPDWKTRISQDDRCSRLRLEQAAASGIIGDNYTQMLEAVHQAEAEASGLSAWRIECTLREFKKPPDINLWFQYPIHTVDTSGVLTDMSAEAAVPSWKKAAKARTKQNATVTKDLAEEFERAVDSAAAGDPPTLKELMDYLNKPERTVRDHIKKFGYTIDKNTGRVVNCGDLKN